MYPRRGFDRWFPEAGRPREQFWRDGPREHFWQDGPCEQLWRDGPHPSWGQCHPEQQWEHSQWERDNYYNHRFPGNFESGGNYRGSVPYRGSYRRRPQGHFHKKSIYHGHLNKGPESSFSKESGDSRKSSCSSNLINVTTSKKENDSEKAEAPSAAHKETKQNRMDSAALAKQSDPRQVWKKTSKVIISAKDFSFRLPHDSLAYPQSKQELPPKKPEEIELVELGAANLKAEDCHRQASCVLAVTLSSTVTLENLRTLKEEKEIELPDWAKSPLEHHKSSSFSKKSLQVAKGPSSQTVSFPCAEMLSEQQEPSQTTEGFHSMKKEALVPVAETKPDMTCPSVTDLSSVVGPPAPLEGREAIPSLGKKETTMVQVKGNQTAEDFPHCTIPLTFIEAPAEQQAPFKPANDFQSMEKEEPVQIQIADSHEDGDRNQIPVAGASGSSSFLTTTSDVHSVPVLVREKKIDLTDFWETPSLHAEHLKGWAPEDYQEPPQSVEEADRCDRMPDHDTDVALYHSSSHSRVSCDKKSNTRRVLEGCSCSPKSHYSSDSRHSSTNWALRELHVQSPPPRARSPPRSPPRRARSPPRSPPRRARSPPRQARSPPRSPLRRARSPPRRARSPLRSPLQRARSPSRRARSPLRSLPRRARSLPRSSLRRARSPPQRSRSPSRSPLQLGWNPPRSPPQQGWSPLRSPPRQDWGSPQSPPQRGWSPMRSPPRRDWDSPQSPPQQGLSPLRSPPRRDWSPPRSPPRQDRYHFRDLWGSPGGIEDNFGTDSCSLYHPKYFKKPSHERCQERDFPSLYSDHKMHRHHSPKERTKSYRVPHPCSPESPTAGKKKKKLTDSEAPEKRRATSRKRTKPLKIKKTREDQSPPSHDSLSSAVEAPIPPKATENVQPLRRKEFQLLQMAADSEDPDSLCRHAGDETGLSAQSWTPSDRSAAVLAKKEEIEQAYQQDVLTFAAVATMLLETQPCMTEVMEAALQATLRKFGNYYEHKLKDFIDHFDLAEES